MTNNMKAPYVKSIENNSTCPVFSGSTAYEFLVFNESWRNHMKFQGVEEIITKGTFHGEILKSTSNSAPNYLETMMKFYNQQVESDTRNIEPFLEKLVQGCVWLIYWWKQVPLPIGHPCSRDPISGDSVYFTPVLASEVDEIIHMIPIGDRDRIFEPDRDPKAEVFYPGTAFASGDLAISAPILQAGGVVIPNPAAVILAPYFKEVLLRQMLKAKLSFEKWTLVELKAKLEPTPVPGHPDFPPSPPLESIQSLQNQLSSFTQNLVEKDYRDQIDKFQKASNDLIALYKTCTIVFSKIGAQGLMLADIEIKALDFRGAYDKIEKYYTQRASSNCDVFEVAAKSIILQPGQDFQAHWIQMQIAWKNWAMVLGLQRDETTFIPTPLVPRQVINSNEAIANSSIYSDTELDSQGYRNLLPETNRIAMLTNSMRPTDERFKLTIESFYVQEAKDRTLRNLLTIIERRENSKPGQEARAKEARSGNKLHKDESSNSKTALVSNEDQTKDKFPAGSCIHHPKSTTHTTSQCRVGPGKASSSNETMKSPHKRPFEERNCSNCEKYNPNRKAFGTHNNETCTFVKPENAKVYKANVAKENENSSTPKPKKDKKKSHYQSNDDQTEDDRIYAMVMSALNSKTQEDNKKSSDGRKN
jgi:hypothetical protein